MPKIRLYHPRIELRVSLQDPRFAKFFRELFEDAIDACDAYALVFGAEDVEDLLGAEAAVLLAEELDDGPAGAAVSEAF